MIDFKPYLLEALKDGPKRPGDLDEELLGSVQMHCVYGRSIPNYGDALTDLIDDGTVEWWRDDRGIVWYKLTTAAG